MIMYELLFDLNFDNTQALLLAFIPGILNLGILTYVLFYLPKNRANITFILFVMAMFAWQMLEVLVRMSGTADTALLWHDLLWISIVLVAPLGFHFSMYFTGKDKIADSLTFNLLLYIPIMFFVLMKSAGFFTVIVNPSDFFGWVMQPDGSLIFKIIVTYLGLLAVGNFWLLLDFTVRSKNNKTQFRKGVIITIGYTIPMFQGLFSELILPYYFASASIPLTTTTISLFSMSIVIAMLKYQMLSYSPEYASKQIIETINEGILITDRDGFIRYTNQHFTDMLGYDKTDLIAEQSKEILQIEDQRKETNYLRTEGNYQQFERRMRNVNGDLVWTIVSRSQYIDESGKFIGYIEVHSDITTAKETEEQLKENDKRFRSLMQTANDAIILTDSKGNVILWNKGAQLVFGYREDEIIGQPFTNLLSNQFSDDSSFSLSNYISGFSDNGDQIFEMVGKKKSGSHFPLEISIARWHSEKDRY
ncbi:MAG: PAS domain S-box protein, partial [Bacteroidetes bacterium]|nr:PAS domain S-box protein [Bacteroidota bacterium]